jgi:hypothetical protein
MEQGRRKPAFFVAFTDASGPSNECPEDAISGDSLTRLARELDVAQGIRGRD